MEMIHHPSWAKSANGLNIELYTSTNLGQPNTQGPVLFIGGTHGDEPEGIRLAEDFIKYIKLQGNLQTPQGQTWAIIPCLNPDGAANNQRTNGNGVDLNRNYPSNNWDSKFDKDRYNPGKAPGSEPEIRALVTWILRKKPRLIVHFHSWEPCIVCTGNAENAAQWLADSSGYKVTPTIGYETPGSLSSFGWDDLNIPVICTEEQEKSDLNKTWSRFGQGLIDILAKY